TGKHADVALELVATEADARGDASGIGFRLVAAEGGEALLQRGEASDGAMEILSIARLQAPSRLFELAGYRGRGPAGQQVIDRPLVGIDRRGLGVLAQPPVRGGEGDSPERMVDLGGDGANRGRLDVSVRVVDRDS